MTYATLETENIRYFYEDFTLEELTTWFEAVINEYGKWMNFLYHHRIRRNQTIVRAEFPFAYRTGQKKLAASVYKTIEGKNRLFVQAPTGIGKTMSVIYPAVKALGEGKGERIFYLTAKTITRTAAEEAFRILQDRGLFFSTITLTAKEKLCPMEKCDCNPEVCPRAKGHFDRVNDAVFDLIGKKERISREDVLAGHWPPRPEVLENLARTEHLRWCAFHLAMGYAPMSDEEFSRRCEMYRKGTLKRISKNTEGLTHACLVPWEALDALSERENAVTGGSVDYKALDTNNVLAIPDILRQV
jgi:Rad3-related DNA helicase